jgi:hypothetical protein
MPIEIQIINQRDYNNKIYSGNRISVVKQNAKSNSVAR